GSVGTTTKLTSVQRKATKHITGALSLAVSNTIEVHVHILPIDLLFHKVLFSAAARICTLPPTHPLHTLSRRAASKYVKCHRSPLQHLFHQTGLHPATTETITPVRRKLNYVVPHSTHIAASKADTLQEPKRSTPVHQYKSM
ncbi:hypothetical protein FIBSPDRAFT_759838, partial [Athelia psychrophila]